ncbi:MAG: VOC family protein [Proteobacteria bacterium]|nr:VOC family protein [Pseudomonadota bacterium]
MSAAFSGFDHVLVGTRELEEARRRFERLGFATTPLGRHRGWGTGNRCILFERGYIELMGILDREKFVNGIDRFIDRGEGLMGLAWAAADGVAAQESLRAKGIPAERSEEIVRPIEDPAGERLPRFRTVGWPEEDSPALWTFIVEHLTPELERDPAWLDHPNGALGLAALTVVVEDPNALTAAYSRLVTGAAVSVADGAVSVVSAGQRLSFVAPEALARFHAGLAPEGAKAAPRQAVLTIPVVELDRTREVLNAGKIGFGDLGDVLRVPPDLACGVWLEFSEAP